MFLDGQLFVFMEVTPIEKRQNRMAYIMYRPIFVTISLFTCVCNILMFCEFEIAVYLFVREIICSPKDFASLRIMILLLKEFAPL